MNPKLKLTITIFLTLHVSYIATGCDCSPLTSQIKYIHKAYEESSLIFLGSVEQTNNDFTSFSIIEIFKGDSLSVIKTNKSSCSIYPKNNEVWLIYLQKDEDGNYVTNYCLPNRNYGINGPLEDLNINDIDNETLNNKYNQILLYTELNKLRQLKILEIIKPNNNKTENNKTLTYGIILLVIISVINLLLIIKKK